LQKIIDQLHCVALSRACNKEGVLPVRIVPKIIWQDMHVAKPRWLAVLVDNKTRSRVPRLRQRGWILGSHAKHGR